MIRSVTTVCLVLATAAGLGCTSSPQARDVEIRQRSLYVDGAPFAIRGIHYGPYAPRTGPGKAYPYPESSALLKDLAMIRRAGANTVLVFDAPSPLLDAAREQGLKVVYTFHVDWSNVQAGVPESLRTRVSDTVAGLREHPALLMWALGNEIPSAAVAQYGEELFIRFIRELYDAVRRLDPVHPVTHSGWPPVKDLDLSFLDVVSFNLYPLWPPEVVARGYGSYIREVLLPIAGNRPLVITEFGINTLEAGEDGQARLLQECWNAIRDLTAGGVVFEFADEWWKNYDNPARPGAWWDRRPALDDEMQHDLDPEEYYGIVTADRRPKRSYGVVSAMFRDDRGARSSVVVAVFLVVAAAAAYIWARGAARRHGLPPP